MAKGLHGGDDPELGGLGLIELLGYIFVWLRRDRGDGVGRPRPTASNLQLWHLVVYGLDFFRGECFQRSGFNISL